MAYVINEDGKIISGIVSKLPETEAIIHFLEDLPIPECPHNLESLKEGESILHNGVVWLGGPVSGTYSFLNVCGFRFRIQFKKCRLGALVFHVPIKCTYCVFIKDDR
jgi:hypothetical protein